MASFYEIDIARLDKLVVVLRTQLAASEERCRELEEDLCDHKASNEDLISVGSRYLSRAESAEREREKDRERLDWIDCQYIEFQPGDEIGKEGWYEAHSHGISLRTESVRDLIDALKMDEDATRATETDKKGGG